MIGFFDKFISGKELTNNNEDKYIFLLEFLLTARSFPKDQMIAKILKNKLNKESKLKLLSSIELSSLKPF